MRRPIVSSLLALWAMPGSAVAGGFYVADIGTQGLSRAGAYVASPDSLLAMHYNPAGLAQLSGLHFEADLSLVDLSATYQRSCPCVDPGIANAAMYDAALMSTFKNHPASTNTPLAIPFIGIAYGFPFADLTIGFAAYGPDAGKYKYGALPPASSPVYEQVAATVPERYVALEASTLEANFQLAAAFQPVSGLRLGGSAMVYQNGNTQTLALWVNSVTFATQPEQPGFDIPLTLTFKRDVAINWSLGASLDVPGVPGLTIGTSFRGKRSIRADGTIDLQLPSVLTQVGAMVSGRQIEIELNTPPIFRAGIQYAVPHVFKVEVAGVREGWSTYDRVVVRPKDVTVTLNGMAQKLDTLYQPRAWNSTFSLRVGAEVNALEPLIGFHAGAFYEPSAIPADRVDASRIDLDKIGFGAGVSTTFFGMTLQLAAMYIAMQTATVTDSQVKQLPPLHAPLGSDQFVTTIANGTYSGNYVIGSASLSFALDPLLSH